MNLVISSSNSEESAGIFSFGRKSSKGSCSTEEMIISDKACGILRESPSLANFLRENDRGLPHVKRNPEDRNLRLDLSKIGTLSSIYPASEEKPFPILSHTSPLSGKLSTNQKCTSEPIMSKSGNVQCEAVDRRFSSSDRGAILHAKPKYNRRALSTSRIEREHRPGYQPIDQDSLFTDRMKKRRNYFPVLELANIRLRLDSFSFNNLRLIGKEKAQRKFNKEVTRYLKTEMDKNVYRLQENGAYSRFEVSAVALQQYLEAFCRDELNKLAENEKSSAISIVISNSPRVKELLKIIMENGLLLKPILHRLIFLFNRLLTVHETKKAYTPWTCNLQKTLWDLIKPDVLPTGETGKKLSEFLFLLDQTYAGVKGKKTIKILNLAVGEKKEERKALIDYLRSWAELPEGSLDKFKDQVKAWSSDNLALLNLTAWQHEWYQHPRQPDHLDSITLHEVMRCFGNEDNGVQIIPKRILIGDKLLHEESTSKHLSFFSFLCKLVGECYVQGLIPKPYRRSAVPEDVEVLSLAKASRKDLSQELLVRIYPLCLNRLVAYLDDNKTFIEDLLQDTVKTALFPLPLQKLFAVMGFNSEEMNKFYEETLMPLAALDFNMLARIPKNERTADPEMLQRLQSSAKQQVCSVISPFFIDSKEITTFVYNKVLREVGSELEKLLEASTGNEPSRSDVAPFYHFSKILGDKIREFNEGPKFSSQALHPLVSENLISLTAIMTGLRREEAFTFLADRILPSLDVGAYIGRCNFIQVSQWVESDLPEDLLHSLTGYLDEILIDKEQISGILIALRKKIGEVLKKCVGTLSKKTISEEGLATRIVPYLSNQFTAVIKSNELELKRSSAITPEQLLQYVPENVWALMSLLGLQHGQALSFLQENVIPSAFEDAQLSSQESKPDEMQLKNSMICRIPQLMRFLRLFTNSCWYHADQCIFKIYPKLKESPFSIKYPRGISFTANILGPEDFSVAFERSITIDKADKIRLSDEDYIVEIPFSWRVQPNGENWTASLSMPRSLSFVKNVHELDKWRFIKTLLNWETVEEQPEEAFSPRILSSSRRSKLFTEEK